jgi:hypothetical protein
LLRSESYRSGGGFIITPGDPAQGVNIKYPLEYSRLSGALTRLATHRVLESDGYEYINMTSLIPELNEMEVIDWLDYEVERDSREDAEPEIDGATRFVSLLSRVDGAVVLDGDLNVHGFGAEITFEEAPELIYVAGDRRASPRRRAVGQYEHFGTRHRSMMRYCWAVPGSTGFVVSHDGGVRAITRVGDAVIMWEDVRLYHEIDYPRRPRRVRPVGGSPEGHRVR